MWQWVQNPRYVSGFEGGAWGKECVVSFKKWEKQGNDSP
jgi:hypothetical protein